MNVPTLRRHGATVISSRLIAGVALFTTTGIANAQEPAAAAATPGAADPVSPPPPADTPPPTAGPAPEPAPPAPPAAETPPPAPPAPPLPSEPVAPVPAEEGATLRELGAVVVTGTRRTSRTVFDSNVPVDVVTREDLETIPSGDLNEKLAQTVPSFNVQRLPMYDGAIFNRPATLRGLAPDQTLVLINGKRRHRSAYIDVTAQGAQAVDLAQIPLSAIERVEVLRDGASAQYGSDAIAGVINIILKDDPGYTGYVQGSRYYEGDGENLLVGANTGFSLDKRGSLNLSLEGGLGAATSRSNQRPDAAALIDGGNVFVRRPAVQRFGQPETKSFVVFVNGKYELAEAAEVYAFGSFGIHWGESDFNYRSPTQGTVFTSIQAPELFEPSFASLPQEYQDWYNNDPAALAGYPGGFTPRFSATSLDGSLVAGVRGNLAPRLTWDLSGRFGVNRIKYHIRDTLNASQGPYSKKEFAPGSRRQTELSANLDFNYELDAGLSSPVNLAFGTEVRRETYHAGLGERDSYTVGPLGVVGLAGGANGYFGTGPEQAGTWSGNSVAGYVDVEADLTRRFNLGAAARVENYQVAGSTLNGKLSSRFSVTDEFNLRCAVSTGFRAPTPGQQNLINTAQYPSPDGSAIVTVGTIPPTNPVSELKGGVPLKPEKSVSVSLGFVVEPVEKLTVSADVYRIEVRDRIGLSQRYFLTPDEREGLVASGVPAAESLAVFNFFVNGYKTRTQGLDVVTSYEIPLGEKSRLNLTGALNLNETKVLSYEEGVIDTFQRQYIEDRLPKRAITAAAELVFGNASVLGRVREYASWTEPLDPTTDDDGRLPFNQTFGQEIFFDLSASYRVARVLRVTVGAENLFDNYPDKARFPNTLDSARAGAIPSNGRIYPSQRPYEADGGRYYARLSFDL